MWVGDYWVCCAVCIEFEIGRNRESERPRVVNRPTFVRNLLRFLSFLSHNIIRESYLWFWTIYAGFKLFKTLAEVREGNKLHLFVASSHVLWFFIKFQVLEDGEICGRAMAIRSIGKLKYIDSISETILLLFTHWIEWRATTVLGYGTLKQSNNLSLLKLYFGCMYSRLFRQLPIHAYPKNKYEEVYWVFSSIQKFWLDKNRKFTCYVFNRW